MAVENSQLRWIVFTVLSVVVASGCQSASMDDDDGPSDEWLLHDWLRRSQGLVGVLPPREDVRVGDVHVYLKDPEVLKRQPLYAMPRWDNLPAADLLADEFRQRPEYPATPAEYLWTEIDPDDRDWPEATDDRDFFAPDDQVGRLPSIHMGSFSLTPANLGEFVPSGAFNLALDERWDNWSLITIRVQAAETAGLPLGDSLRAFLTKEEGDYFLPEQLRDNLTALSPKGSNTVWVRIVTEVVYMRAMQITILGERRLLNRNDPVEASELGISAEKGSDARADDELDPAYGAIARANAINKAMVESGTDALPGSFIRFLSVSDDLISVRRVYHRGIAIGVRGLSLEVDAATGKVRKIRLMGRAPEVELDPLPEEGAEEHAEVGA